MFVPNSFKNTILLLFKKYNSELSDRMYDEKTKKIPWGKKNIYTYINAYFDAVSKNYKIVVKKEYWIKRKSQFNFLFNFVRMFIKCDYLIVFYYY